MYSLINRETREIEELDFESLMAKPIVKEIFEPMSDEERSFNLNRLENGGFFSQGKVLIEKLPAPASE